MSGLSNLGCPFSTHRILSRAAGLVLLLAGLLLGEPSSMWREDELAWSRPEMLLPGQVKPYDSLSLSISTPKKLVPMGGFL